MQTEKHSKNGMMGDAKNKAGTSVNGYYVNFRHIGAEKGPVFGCFRNADSGAFYTGFYQAAGGGCSWIGRRPGQKSDEKMKNRLPDTPHVQAGVPFLRRNAFSVALQPRKNFY